MQQRGDERQHADVLRVFQRRVPGARDGWLRHEDLPPAVLRCVPVSSRQALTLVHVSARPAFVFVYVSSLVTDSTQRIPQTRVYR